MLKARSEQSINYEVTCPYCGEISYSEYCDDWDTVENVHIDLEIECMNDDCEKHFIVQFPH